MRNSKAQKRQLLFNKFAANLSFYTKGRLENQFICPLCKNAFDSIQNLSDAHIFPDALGGRSVTLTCKDCNSTVGSQIEIYGIEQANLQRRLSGAGQESQKVLMSLPERLNYPHNTGKVTADLQFIQNGDVRTLRFIPRLQSSAPRALEEIEKCLDSNEPIDIEFTAKANPRKAELTYLHSAFLFLFSQLGYQWVLDPCAEVIREQLQNPEKEHIKFSTIPLTYGNFWDTLPDGKSQTSWYLITDPEISKGFLIVFSGLDYLDNPLGVWMPLFENLSYQMPKHPDFQALPLPVLSNQEIPEFNKIELYIKAYLNNKRN